MLPLIKIYCGSTAAAMPNINFVLGRKHSDMLSNLRILDMLMQLMKRRSTPAPILINPEQANPI